MLAGRIGCHRRGVNAGPIHCMKLWIVAGRSADMDLSGAEFEHHHAILEGLDTIQRRELPIRYGAFRCPVEGPIRHGTVDAGPMHTAVCIDMEAHDDPTLSPEPPGASGIVGQLCRDRRKGRSATILGAHHPFDIGRNRQFVTRDERPTPRWSQSRQIDGRNAAAGGQNKAETGSKCSHGRKLAARREPRKSAFSASQGPPMLNNS